MRLVSIEYAEFEGTPQEWKLEGLTLGARNLLVGKNATGKSRSLNMIDSLSQYLTGARPTATSGNYDTVFANGSQNLRYKLKFEQEQVIEEQFSVDNEIGLVRSEGGEGRIWAEEIDGGKMIRFQTPPGELAAVARRDSIQHGFLEPLYAWASSVRRFNFGSTLGQNHLAVFVEKGGRKPDDRDQNAVVALYRQAETEFNNELKQAVLTDMAELDYPIENVGLQSPVSSRIPQGPLSESVGLFVKEKGLSGITDQLSMSQGMFRSLSVLVQVNYSQMARRAACVLIDDIGEGLDFDRSCRLIDLLRRKASESDIQLIMATNDRFVMNRVPLEEWSVLQRQGNHVRVRNYRNSQEVFEEFKFTGLSNFDFLATDFLDAVEANASP